MALGAVAGLVATSLVAVVPARADDSEVIDDVTYEAAGVNPVPCWDGAGASVELPPARAVGNALQAGAGYVAPRTVLIGGSEHCVTEIGDGAFRGAALGTVTLAGDDGTGNITSIGASAFAEAEIRGRFEIGGRVAVGDGAFSRLASDSDVQFLFTGVRDSSAPIGVDPFAGVTNTDIYYPADTEGYEDFPGEVGDGTLATAYTPGTLAVAQAVGTVTAPSGTPQLRGSVDTAQMTINFSVPDDSTSIDVSLRFLATDDAWTGGHLVTDRDSTTYAFDVTPYGASGQQTWEVHVTKGVPHDKVVKGVTYTFEGKTSTTGFPEQCGNTENLLGVATAVRADYWNAATQGGVLEVVQEPVPGYCTTTLAGALTHDAGIEHVKLPPTITRIPSYLFFNHSLLRSVDFGGTDDVSPALTVIDEYAFAESSVETGDLSSLVNLTTIGDSAFREAKVGVVTLPEGLKTIGNAAFAQAGVRGTLVIPESVTSIGASAFGNNDPEYGSGDLRAVSFTKPTAEGVVFGTGAMSSVVAVVNHPDDGHETWQAALRPYPVPTAPLGADEAVVWSMAASYTVPGAVPGTGDVVVEGVVDPRAKTVTFTGIPDGVEQLVPITGFGGSAIDPAQGEPIAIAGTGSTSATVAVTPLLGGDAVEWTITVQRETPPPTPDRPFAGTDRLETSCMAAGDLVPGEPLVIANVRSYADAAAGVGALQQTHGALILTEGNALNPCVKDKVMDNPPGRVVIVGGTGVVSAPVKQSLEAIADSLPGHVPVQRLSGKDRYETAARIAQATIPAKHGELVLTSGVAIADQATAASLAHGVGGPVVYLPPDATTAPEWLVDIIRMFEIQKVHVVGGPLAANDDLIADLDKNAAAIEYAGVNRFETAAKAAIEWGAITHVALANGADPIDGIAAAPRMGQAGVPVLLTPANCLDPHAAAVIDQHPLTNLTLLGGRSALTDEVGQMRTCGA